MTNQFDNSERSILGVGVEPVSEGQSHKADSRQPVIAPLDTAWPTLFI